MIHFATLARCVGAKHNQVSFCSCGKRKRSHSFLACNVEVSFVDETGDSTKSAGWLTLTGP